MPVNTRKVVGVLVWLLVAGLLGLAVYFAVSGSSGDSRLTLLRDRGVAVQATVTGCTAVSSGIGMGIEYWDCRALYDLGGRRFSAPLGGNRGLLDAGSTVAAVAVPGHPGLLWTAAGVRRGQSSTASYSAAVALGAAGVLVGAARGFAVRRRRGRAGSASGRRAG